VIGRCLRKVEVISQRLWNLKAITCQLLVSSRSLHGPTDSKLPKKSHTFSGWFPGKHRSFEESPDSSKAAMFPRKNRTSSRCRILGKGPKGGSRTYGERFLPKKTRKFWCLAFFVDSPFLLVTRFFLWATQKKTCKNYWKVRITLQLKYPFHTFHVVQSPWALILPIPVW